MPINRFLYNKKNLIKGVPVIATDVRSTGNAVKTTSIVRQGTGDARLINPFDGDEDATFDVKIVTDTSGTKTISEVEFQGVGNGVMNAVSSTGLDAQDIIVELIDLGTQTTFAATDLFGGLLKAKTAGPPGNAVRIIVDLTNIVRTAINFSIFSNISKGQETFEGDEFFYGDAYNKPLDALGNVIPDTKRISFGTDPQVYKMYRIFEIFRYIHYLTPIAIRDIPEGTVVNEVTGFYKVTIQDDIKPTEIYSNIITRFDFLDAILSSSLIVTFDGAVAQDFSPAGMATLDFDLVTQPFDLPIETDGSSFVNELQNTDLAIILQPTHPTETVELKCVNNDSVGSEEWSITGQLSGLRALNAITNVKYLDFILDLINFKIPEKTAPAQDALMRLIKITYATRGGGEFKPPICPDKLTLGTGAVAKTITLTYTERPVLKAGCECESTSFQGVIRPFCLGFTDNLSEGGEILEQPYKQRLHTLYKWASDFIAGNTAALQAKVGFVISGSLIRKFTATFGHDRVEIGVSDRVRSIFHAGLEHTREHETNSAADWQPITTYNIDDIILSTTINRYYKCILGHTSAASEPIWPADWTDVLGLWRDFGPVPLKTWDASFDAMETAFSVIAGQVNSDYWRFLNILDKEDETHKLWTPTTVKANLEKGWPAAGSLESKYTLTVDNAGAGITGAIEPIWNSFKPGDQVTDGTVLWNLDWYEQDEEKFAQEFDEALDFFLKQYTAQMNEVIVTTDNEPIFSFELASTATGSGGTPCWKDYPDETHFWSINNDEYLQAFNNVVYHAVQSFFDEDAGQTVIFPTFEFAFLIRVECVSDLKPGDQIFLEITGDLKAYAVDDIIEIPVIRAEPRFLTGGQTGNNLLTWRVTGEVDTFIDYILDLLAPNVYLDNGLTFLITPGGIAFDFSSNGTKFLFSIEAGQFQWRKNLGPYSGNMSILSTPTPLSDGLSVQFFPGPAPSFEIDDIFSFQAIQQNAPSHTEEPDFDFWMYDDPIITLTYTLGGTFDFDTIGLFHDLPSGATIQIYGSTDGFVVSNFLITTLTWKENLIVEFLSSPSTVTHIRLYLANAADGKVYWLNIEENWIISFQAQVLELSENYSMTAGAGPGKNAFFSGRGQGGKIEWNRWLKESDIDNIKEMVRYLKENNEEFCIFVPNKNHPENARLVKINTDEVLIVDRYRYAPIDNSKFIEERFQVRLPLQGVFL